MDDFIVPVVGDIWQDANGHHNLILKADELEQSFTTLCLEQGKYWYDEPLDDWNNPAACSKMDGKPFYRLLVA